MDLAINKLALGGDEEKLKVQAAVIDRAKKDGQKIIDQYKQHPSTFDGRYICSDMFKEMFPEFSQSPATRNKFNNAVHNTAATLAAEHFKQTMRQTGAEGQDTVIFLTGSPGAGKTSSVVSNMQLPANVKAVYEGQLVNATDKSTLDKFQQAINSGAKIEVIAVHALPENALENTFKRFNDPNDGRGASIGTMARIQGNTAEGLEKLHDFFGDRINLRVLDVRQQGNAVPLKGWQHLNVLKSEGNEHDIKQRLEKHLLKHWQQGAITNECFEQAAGGKAEFHRLTRGTDGQSAGHNGGQLEPHEPGRKLPQGSGSQGDNPTRQQQEAILKLRAVALHVGADVRQQMPGETKGKIVAETSGFILQRLGKSSKFFMVHDKSSLATVPRIDDEVKILHRKDPNQKARVELVNQTQSQSQNKGRTR